MDRDGESRKPKQSRAEQSRPSQVSTLTLPWHQGSFSLEAFVPHVPGAPGVPFLCVGPRSFSLPRNSHLSGLLPHPSWSFPFPTQCLWASLRLGNPRVPGPLKSEPHWACRLPAFKGAQNKLQSYGVVSGGRWGAEDGLPGLSLEIREQKSIEASTLILSHGLLVLTSQS